MFDTAIVGISCNKDEILWASKLPSHTTTLGQSLSLSDGSRMSQSKLSSPLLLSVGISLTPVLS